LGLSKVPENRIKQVLEFIEPRCVAVDALGTFIYPTTADPADFKGFRSSQEQITRQPSEISLVEYANAAVWLLESVRSLSVDDMTRELGGLFGFKRMTQKVTGVLQQALDAAVASGRLAREEDRFRLPS